MPDSFDHLLGGIRVRVSFGRRRRLGFITSIFNGANQSNYKDIYEVMDSSPLFSAQLLKLTKWIAEYYLCHWGEVLAASIPTGLHHRSQAKYRLSPTGLAQNWLRASNDDSAHLWNMLYKGKTTLRQIRQKIAKGEALFRDFRERGWVEEVLSESHKPLYRLDNLWEWTGEIDFMSALDNLPASAHRLRKAVNVLAEVNGALLGTELKKHGGGLSPQLRSLTKRGWVRWKSVPRDLDGISQEGISETGSEDAQLSETQTDLVAEVMTSCNSGETKVFLLHGVTGSGKTLVYLEIVERVIKAGKGVIVMIPEISLTPQLTGRFKRRFGDAVALTHSRMTVAQRRDIWQRVKSGLVKVVIGPRSVIFSPVSNLGLILIDEEHDESYKQVNPAPRYNGRDVAIYRAYLAGAVTLLGSATPDITSYYNALNAKYKLLEMPDRYGGTKLPEVELAHWGLGKEGRIFSPVLKEKIQDRLALNEQVILLVNRRGFSSCIRCPDCGTVAECPNCDIMLRYHKVGKKLECHYCGYIEKVFDRCPKCQGQRMRYNGIGTQRVEKELAHIFPEAKIARMDFDTTKGQGAHQNILSCFANREFNVLLGTKMVAKGHDFPDVTLVGILAADMEWLRPDFRAVEKAFRLLVQASGRAGRLKKGEVVIQTWQPSKEVLGWVKNHNYAQMYHSELKSRQQLSYPPFGRLIMLIFSGDNRERVREIAKSFNTEIRSQLTHRKILGPAPPPIEKLENMYRQRIMIKMPAHFNLAARREKNLIWEMVCAYNKQYAKWKIRVSVDVDPVEL